MIKKIGFIGAGLINQYCHIPSFNEINSVELNSICDENENLLNKVYQKFSFKKKFTNIDDFLNNKELDAIVLTVGREDTLKVIEKIYKKRSVFILCEKPFGQKFNQSQSIINKYKKNSNKTVIGYMKKYEPAFLDLKKIIKSKKYGKLLSCTIKNSMGNSYCNPFNYEKRLDHLKYIKKIKHVKNKVFKNYLNVFCHDYNIILDLLGNNYKIISANLNKIGEGRVNLSINNIPVSIDTNYNNNKEWYEVIKFNFATAEIKISFPPALLINKLAGLEIVDYKKNNKIFYDYNPNWSFRIQAKIFTDYINGKIKNPNNTKNAIFDLKLIEEIWKT